MNEEIRPIIVERIDPETEKRELKRTYSRCGWVLFAFTAIGYIVPRVIDGFVADAGDEVKRLFAEYLLIYNSILVGISTLAAVLLLFLIPKSAPARQKIKAKEFLMYVFIAFGISWVGGMISKFFINTVYFISGVQLTDRVSAALGFVKPWQAILCSVIIAPFTEEFLFRKVLIDRLYKHGELLAILSSAVFFGLFHQNVYQLVYAFGVGFLLGFVYCKTGSYLVTTALHMIFNLIGVLPVFFTNKIAQYAEMTKEELAALPPEVYAQYSSAMTGYILYSLVILAINIVGIIVFLINKKNFSVENNAPTLLESDKREIVIRAPGIVAAGCAMIILTFLSLFI
jgi:membrane protease YdiL (CAAX protease family)